MKSVLLSIHPKWCELIASGKKTVEVRKTKPKLETPFKCYIYCTKERRKTDFITKSEVFGYINAPEHTFCNRAKEYDANGKVIGEFVCDTFITDRTFGHDALFNAAACFRDADAASYCLNKEMYGWHISDLKIYDKPRALAEFKRVCDGNCQECKYAIWQTRHPYDDPIIVDCKPISVPQSWCYVEVGDPECK